MVRGSHADIPQKRQSRKRLNKKNRQLLAWLKEWRSTPDEMGKEWWDEFDRQLEENRLNFDREKSE